MSQLTRSVELVSIAAEYYGGSRVEKFKPIFEIISQVVDILNTSTLKHPKTDNERNQLAKVTLRLSLAVISAHRKEVNHFD